MTPVPPRVHFVALTGSLAPIVAYGWRLLGSNNRELGRGSTAGSSLAESVELVTALQEALPRASTHHSREVGSSGWRWSLAIDNVEWAHSARDFRRERESHYNAEAFVAALEIALVRLPERDDRLPSTRRDSFLPAARMASGNLAASSVKAVL